MIVAIIIVGGMMMYFGMMNSSGSREVQQELNSSSSTNAPGVSQPQSLPGRAIRKARDTECQSNLNQLRQFIMMSQGTDGKYPPSLASIQGTEQIRECPVCHQPYSYDPETGQVKCTYPGHEKF